jgi:hypothetical protein
MLIFNVDYTTDSIANALAIIDTHQVKPPKAISEKEIVLHFLNHFKAFGIESSKTLRYLMQP